jgi:hypothetical protein
MTEGAEAAYKAANHTAFVLGYTGEVGKELVKVRPWTYGILTINVPYGHMSEAQTYWLNAHRVK